MSSFSLDLTSYANIERKVMATYRNGEKEAVFIQPSSRANRIIVSFDPNKRNNNPEVIKMLEMHSTEFICNDYQIDGRVNNHSKDLSDSEKHDHDIIAVSLCLDGTGYSVATPCA